MHRIKTSDILPLPPLLPLSKFDRKILGVNSSWKRRCVANNTSLWRESERASEREKERWRGEEEVGNVFRDLQTDRGDAGRRFRGWILGPRGEAGGRLLKPGRGTDSTTYIRFFLLPPLSLLISASVTEPRSRTALSCWLGTVSRGTSELPAASAQENNEQREENGTWSIKAGFSRLDLSLV